MVKLSDLFISLCYFQVTHVCKGTSIEHSNYIYIYMHICVYICMFARHIHIYVIYIYNMYIYIFVMLYGDDTHVLNMYVC